MADFYDLFSDNMDSAGRALEDKGFDVIGYWVDIEDYSGNIASNGSSHSSSEALEQTISELKGVDELYMPISGDEFVDALETHESIKNPFYRSINGRIELDDPMTEVDWDDAPVPSIVTNVIYVPEFPEDYFEVAIIDRQPPANRKDAKERMNSVIRALKGSGFDTKKGHIN